MDQKNTEMLPAVRRARIGWLTIYDVSESELQLLERGSPQSPLLNLATAMLSAALGILVALLTTTVEST